MLRCKAEAASAAGLLAGCKPTVCVAPFSACGEGAALSTGAAAAEAARASVSKRSRAACLATASTSDPGVMGTGNTAAGWSGPMLAGTATAGGLHAWPRRGEAPVLGDPSGLGSAAAADQARLWGCCAGRAGVKGGDSARQPPTGCEARLPAASQVARADTGIVHQSQEVVQHTSFCTVSLLIKSSRQSTRSGLSLIAAAFGML